MRDEDADAQAGRGPDLRERLADHHVRMRGQLGQQRRAREVAVRLVDQHQRFGVRFRDREDRVEGDLVAGRVVRRREHDDVGVGLGGGPDRTLARDVVRQADELVDDGAPGDDREARVHRVRRLEQQCRATVTAEYEERVEQDLVAAVPEDDLLGCHFPSSR